MLRIQKELIGGEEGFWNLGIEDEYLGRKKAMEIG